MATTRPFSRYEFMIAWRYLRAKRAEGGVAVITWISLIGITLAVFALIATMAVRSGYRSEFVDIILGVNAHVTVYQIPVTDDYGRLDDTIHDYQIITDKIRAIPGVTRAAPLIKGEILMSHQGENAGAQIYGISFDDLMTLPRIAKPESHIGDIRDFDQGIAIGSGLARELGVGLGDRVKLISPDGVKTAFGTSPRVKSFDVVYIFTAGRYDIDRTRAYLPFEAAQSYFNREGSADEIEVMVEHPEDIDAYIEPLYEASQPLGQTWTWKQRSGNFLRALEMEDNVMLVINTILILISALSIVSGLIMLVKNKGRDIGVLRTIGLTQGAIMRVFFLCGAFNGVVGTAFGTLLGCLFAIYIDTIFAFINYVSGGGVWDPSIRGIYAVPAQLFLSDVLFAIGLSLGLSFFITIFPARQAARLNPVEALRYE